MIRMTCAQSSWALKQPLKFAFAELTAIDVLTVELTSGDLSGRGEGIGVFFRGDTPEAGAEALAALGDGFVDVESARAICGRLDSYAARNALDCALWDLQCKLGMTPIRRLIGSPDGPVDTFETISLGPPDAMAVAAREVAGNRLKLKVNGPGIIEQVRAVRGARGDAILMADANQDLSFERLQEVVPSLAEMGLVLLEQPLPAGQDSCLSDFRSPVPLCADESCFSAEDVAGLSGRYDAVNIKLDKAGGLTGGLAVLAEARRHGLGTLVGCMAGTSLSMAPALALAAMCDFADLDGPLLLADDYNNAARYLNGVVYAPPAEFWG